jgi:predicted N-acyltransferase
MAYSYTLYHSINQVDAGEWQCLRRGPRDVFMDPRFLRVAERSMAGRTECAYVVFRDEQQLPVAAACLYSSRLDATLLLKGRAKQVLQMVARAYPLLKSVPMECTGVPVPSGQSYVRFADGVDIDEILRLLDDLLGRMAARHGARFISIGEFDAEESSQMALLEQLGYQRMPQEPMHQMRGGFRDFDGFCASLNARKRYPISRSRKKFAQAGLRVVHVRGAEGADRLYTDEVHRLFCAVVEDKPRGEDVPAAFFRLLATDMPEESVFTFIYEGQRVVAFAASVCAADTFHQLLVGYDRQLNPSCDLYFNLFFNAVDYGLQQGATEIFLGQTSSEFKMQKFDAAQVPRYFYIKNLRRLGAVALRFLAKKTAALKV